ncbi:hypothetical protein RRG08_060409 [Elysia crispata]|uniref:Apple domain-containing protein n=1 Tax=Elysia crispata TaxID=231223 RepID=A0AAE1E0J2_9GAST|nr:hypothetical protein RRG08_060409 [Elysia crispata]
MSVGRSGTCLLLVSVALGLASGVTDQAKFVKEPGQKIVSNADQLVSFSKPAMSNILCAASCRIHSDCSLYHFSPVTNICATFKERSSFDPFTDVVFDKDWTTGYLSNASSVRRGSWVLVFRGQSRIGVPVYDTWVNTSKHDDGPLLGDFPYACLRLTDYKQCNRHFRSHIVDKWVNIQEARFSLVKADTEVAYIVFDATGSDKISWFSQNRILHSTWSPALDTANDLQPVNMKGNCYKNSICRRFQIYQKYKYCKSEAFYTFTVDMAGDSCSESSWVLRDFSTFPVFLYSPGTGRCSIGTDRGSYILGDEADVMSVWVKFV